MLTGVQGDGVQAVHKGSNTCLGVFVGSAEVCDDLNGLTGTYSRRWLCEQKRVGTLMQGRPFAMVEGWYMHRLCMQSVYDSFFKAAPSMLIMLVVDVCLQLLLGEDVVCPYQ